MLFSFVLSLGCVVCHRGLLWHLVFVLWATWTDTEATILGEGEFLCHLVFVPWANGLPQWLPS